MKQSSNGSTPSRNSSIPNTPELLAFRRQAEANIRRQRGEKWWEENKDYLDAWWEAAKAVM